MRLSELNAMLPTAPYDLQEECELYARESGRHAKLHYFPGAGWFVRFSLRPNDDKRLLLAQAGMIAEEEIGEDVFFSVPDPRRDARPGDMIPLDINQMGRSGIREFLERGNSWSGRGQYTSIVDAHLKAREANRLQKIKLRQEMKEANRQRQREQRRWWLKIPLVQVGIELARKGTNKRSKS